MAQPFAYPVPLELGETWQCLPIPFILAVHSRTEEKQHRLSAILGFTPDFEPCEKNVGWKTMGNKL